MKYLVKFFVPYDSLFETNTLLTSMSSVLNSFLFLQKLLLLIFFCLENLCSFHSFLYWVIKKVKKNNNNNLGIL